MSSRPSKSCISRRPAATAQWSTYPLKFEPSEDSASRAASSNFRAETMANATPKAPLRDFETPTSPRERIDDLIARMTLAEKVDCFTPIKCSAARRAR